MAKWKNHSENHPDVSTLSSAHLCVFTFRVSKLLTYGQWELSHSENMIDFMKRGHWVPENPGHSLLYLKQDHSSDSADGAVTVPVGI